MNVKKLNNGILVLFVVLYFVSPIDIIPDAIPGFGQIDEIIIGLIAYALFDWGKESEE